MTSKKRHGTGKSADSGSSGPGRRGGGGPSSGAGASRGGGPKPPPSADTRPQPQPWSPGASPFADDDLTLVDPDPLLPGPAEKSLVDLMYIMSRQEFADIDEMNAFVSTLLDAGPLPQALPTTPLERAQQLVYQAVEVEGKQRIALARKALTFSKDCADALIILALETTKNEADRVRLFRQAMEAGERVLEASPHEEHLPHLWSFLPARPYLRALMGVGLAEWDRGARLAAVDALSLLLSVSADDPQGARYYLLGWLLDIDDTVLARDLLEGEWEESATWLWADVLLAFKLGGESAARPRLRTAMEENPLVPDAIFDGADEIDAADETDEAGGGETKRLTNLEFEASLVAQHLAEAWSRDLAAFWWLDEEIEAHWPEEVRDALRVAAEAEMDEDGAESEVDRGE